MTVEYLKGAEPLYLKGSDVGCLLLHGAGGGTAWDLKEFAGLLNQRLGLTVWLPTLKGFGTRPEDLLGITLDEWIADAKSGVDKLRQDCRIVVIVGHSVGGLLALLLAAEDRDVHALVVWSTPLRILDRRLPLLPFIGRIPLLRRIIPERIPAVVPEEIRQQGWVGYDWIPSDVAFALTDGIKRAKRALSSVKCPIAIMQGARDSVVSSDSPRMIHDNVASRVKELWFIEEADHPMMNEQGHKDELFSRSLSFIERAIR